MVNPHRSWRHYVNAAVGAVPGDSGAPAGTAQTGTAAAAGSESHLPVRLERLRCRVKGTLFAVRPPAPATPRRSDIRLVPAAVLVWACAVAGGRLAPAALGALCLGLLAGSALLLRMARAAARTPGPRPAGRAPAAGSRPAGRRSTQATLAVALLLAAATGAHSSVAAAQRHDGAVAEAAAAGAEVAAELEVLAAPRRLRSPGSSGLADRWAVSATLLALDFDGRRVLARARLLVTGGSDWADAAPGQRIRTTGRLRPPDPGQAEAAALSASSAARLLRPAARWQLAPAELRNRFTAAAARLDGDARGLLPGMVTGDTSTLDPGLEAAMKTVGMTHLTAVSGANCSLVLGTLLILARALRLRRAVAATASLAGLGLFVLLVGPDASVLRAAVMGAVGLIALTGGRAGRGLSSLCLAVIGLLLAEPALSVSFGFVLSVLATLGIVVSGRPVMGWFPDAVPRWAAAGLAVPLSAQTFCGPVIVLLQPEFSTYALAANVAAAVLVVPVTLLGTAAVPLVALVPAAATLPLEIAAVFARAVAGVARYFAALPGAVLPWPEGGLGAVTMAMLSGVVLACCWLAFHAGQAVHVAVAAHARTVAWLARREGCRERRRGGPGRAHGGLVDGSDRGRLRVCKQTSGRKLQWLLPRPHAPGLPRRTPPPGGT
jgi:competence protein ComEC